jgi:hypothetical protein
LGKRIIEVIDFIPKFLNEAQLTWAASECSLSAAARDASTSRDIRQPQI